MAFLGAIGLWSSGLSECNRIEFLLSEIFIYTIFFLLKALVVLLFCDNWALFRA